VLQLFYIVEFFYNKTALTTTLSGHSSSRYYLFLQIEDKKIWFLRTFIYILYNIDNKASLIVRMFCNEHHLFIH
jgi:hypothetical protein